MLVLIAALVGGVMLVKNNQDTKRGATFASVQALFLPDTQSIQVGKSIITTLMLDTSVHYLTGADLRIKYDQDKLSLDSVTVLTKENFTGGIPWLQSSGEVLISGIDSKSGTFSLAGTNMQKNGMSLPVGLVSIVKLNFTAIASGEAKVSLDTSYSNVIAGYNLAGSDQELGIDKISGATYEIGGNNGVTEIHCGWCGTSCIDLNKMKGACAQIYVTGKTCVNNNGNCVILTSANVTPRVSLVPTTTRKITPQVKIY